MGDRGMQGDSSIRLARISRNANKGESEKKESAREEKKPKRSLISKNKRTNGSSRRDAGNNNGNNNSKEYDDIPIYTADELEQLRKTGSIPTRRQDKAEEKSHSGKDYFSGEDSPNADDSNNNNNNNNNNNSKTDNGTATYTQKNNVGLAEISNNYYNNPVASWRKALAIIIDLLTITYLLAYPFYAVLGSSTLAAESYTLLKISAWLALIAFIYAYTFIMINRATIGMYITGIRLVPKEKGGSEWFRTAKYSLLYSSAFIMLIAMLMEIISYVIMKEESMFEMLSKLKYITADKKEKGE